MTFAPSTLLTSRRLRLALALETSGCDALVVTHLPNLFYLTNFAGSAGAAIVSPAGLTLVLDARYVAEAEHLRDSEHGPRDARLVRVESSYDQTIAGVLRGIGACRAGFEADHLAFGRHARLRTGLGAGTELVPTSGLVERLRQLKDAHEIAALRTAARLVSRVALAVVSHVKAGLRERDLAALIDCEMRRAGFSRPAFDTIVGSGPNGALPHATASERILRAGDLVVLDFGGVRDGYCADLTRTVSIGPAAEEQRRIYQAVLEAQAAALASVRSGVTTGEIDRAARDVLESRGLGAGFVHGTGHGLGIEVHELPSLTPIRAEDRAGDPPRPWAVPVEPGMVFTVEPGTYLPGWGGVRIEDDVLVTNEGCEVLTGAPRELIER
ncbi:MAG TPA: Xaa-Pro peptidase family protein [Vicinamibacterales bacterium]|jgi:Xaa-Pro aminopeptidase